MKKVIDVANYDVLTFQTLDSALKQLSAGIGTSELHGLATGLVVAGVPKADGVQTLAAELSIDPTSHHIERMLVSLYLQVSREINHENFGFHILVPPDLDASVVLRADNMSFWCRGFLCGLGLGNISQYAIQSDVVAEAVKDLSQFAYVAIDCQESEEDEKALSDLLEYIRIAVQNIYVELKTCSIKERELPTVH